MSKRKHISLPLKAKLDALSKIDKGVSLKTIADELGVSAVTVGDWKRNRAKLESWTSGKNFSPSASTSRSRMKTSEYEKTSEALFVWFCTQRRKGTPISGPILKEKAQFFQQRLKEGEVNFTASSGWLDNWKKRYGVRQLHVSGEKLSADSKSADLFVERLRTIIENEKLTRKQLYNCDETGLNFKMLPDKSLASHDEKSAPGHKMSKERITVLPCSNASGEHKLRLLVIGKSKKPRAFKNLNLQGLPTAYRNQKSAWMDTNIFKEWFFREFVPEVETFLNNEGLPRKALLLIDNAPSHPSAEELSSGDIKTIFLPPNVTSLVQPMDQNVIVSLKKKYRRKLLTHILHQDDESLVDVLKRVNLKDVIYWLGEAWAEITTETLQKSWTKILKSSGEPGNLVIDRDNTNNDEDNRVLLELISDIPGCGQDSVNDLKEWLVSDDSEELSDEMVVELVNQEVSGENEDTTADDHDNPPKISHSEGFRRLEKALEYVEQQEEITPADILFFKQWSTRAAKKRGALQKQRKIDDFFK